MNSFVEFLNEDVNAKKELITTMPMRLKKDKIIFNNRLDEIITKYSKYKEVVLKELVKRYNKEKIQVRTEDNTTKAKNIENKISEIEKYINYTNPINTFFDKLDFYKYFYILYRYEDYTFTEFNDAIDKILTIFENAGIKITGKDFYYNYYVTKYMEEFIENRKAKKPFNNLLSSFEEYYWHDSHIVKNIYLNLRSIIEKNKKQLDKYTEKIIKKYEQESGIKSVKECNELLEKQFLALAELHKEDIEIILEKALRKEIDINNYLENSKVKKEVFDNMQIESIDETDEKQYKRFYENLEKLKNDLIQYKMFYQVQGMINNYKEDFNQDEIKDDPKKIKKLLLEIAAKEKKLKKYNNKLSLKYISKKTKEKMMKQTETEALDISKEIMGLYENFDILFMQNRMTPFYEEPINIENVLNIYYSFRFYQLKTIRKMYQQAIPIKTLMYDSKKFDRLVIDPTHDLINVVPVFVDYHIKDVLLKKHRLNNLNILKADLDHDVIEDLTKKVDLLLRDKIIKESKFTAEKMNDIVKIYNILKKENLIEET